MNRKTALISLFFFVIILVASSYFLLKFVQKPLPALFIRSQDNSALLSFSMDRESLEKFTELFKKAGVPVDFPQDLEIGLDKTSLAALKNTGEIKVDLKPYDDGFSFGLSKNFPGKTADNFLGTKYFPESTLVYFSSTQYAPNLLDLLSQNWPKELSVFLKQIYTQNDNFSFGIFEKDGELAYGLVARVENPGVVTQNLSGFQKVADEIKKHISSEGGIAVGFKEGRQEGIKTYTLTLPRGFSEEFKTSDLIIAVGVFGDNLVAASSEEALAQMEKIIAGKENSLEQKISPRSKPMTVSSLWIGNPAEVFRPDFLSRVPLGKMELGQKNFAGYFEKIAQIEVAVKNTGVEGFVELK